MNCCDIASAIKKYSALFILGMMLSSVFSISFAGQTGKIAGKITDAKTNDPLIGVTVILDGTRMGAATDIDGYYYINNIVPGTYTLTVSNVGYAKAVVQNVNVKIDLTTTIDVQLEEASVIGKEVVIQAERPLVQKDLTSSSVTVSSDEMKVMPVENINQVINLQAGVVGGHFRGGRTGEVAYLVDGLPVNNPADGGLGLTPENSSIREMEVISGTFNAEYGQAMSGVVNIVTQDGSEKYSGTFSAYLGDYFTKHTGTFVNLDKLNLTRSKDFQASLSGPTMILSGLTFFATGRYFKNEGYLYGKRVFNPSDDIVPVYGSDGTQIRIPSNSNFTLPSNLATDESGNLYYINATGDGAYVPMNPSRKYSGNGKLTYSLGDFKLSYGLFWEDNFNKYYDHGYKLTPDGVMSHYSRNMIHNFQISHIISQSTFQTLKFSLNSYRAHGELYENPYDSRYVSPDQGSPHTNYTFRSGGNYGGRYESNTQTLIGQWSLSSQVSKEHKIGIGIEGRQHHIFVHDLHLTNATKGIYDSLGNEIFTIGYSDPGYNDRSELTQMYDKRPVEASAYIQDKMEYSDMIINAGVRFDYFDPNTKMLRDLKNPERDTNYDTGFITVKEKTQVSPRLGISFPITDQGIIHFSYGHFFQIPTFQNLFYNPDYYVSTSTSLVSINGNPDLKAQKTISYELGLQQVLFTNIGIDFTVYYRDIRDLLATELIKTYQGVTYGRYTNLDYGNVRGFVVALEKRFADYYSLRVDYTYQQAEGDASDPLSAFYNNQSNPPVETNKILVPLNWDQRNTLNVNLTVGELGNWTAGLIFQFGSGFPYTPDTRITQLRFENGGIKPQSYNLDMRLEKSIPLGSMNLSLFALVYNVLDTKNETNVDAASGRANIDLYTSQNAQKIVGVNTIAEYQDNPSSFSAPRQIRLGFNLGF